MVFLFLYKVDDQIHLLQPCLLKGFSSLMSSRPPLSGTAASYFWLIYILSWPLYKPGMTFVSFFHSHNSPLCGHRCELRKTCWYSNSGWCLSLGHLPMQFTYIPWPYLCSNIGASLLSNNGLIVFWHVQPFDLLSLTDPSLCWALLAVWSLDWIFVPTKARSIPGAVFRVVYNSPLHPAWSWSTNLGMYILIPLLRCAVNFIWRLFSPLMSPIAHFLLYHMAQVAGLLTL